MQVANNKTFLITCSVSLLLVLFAMFGCTNTSILTTVSAGSVELNVCAGVGLTDVLTEINDLYEQKNNDVKIVANFAAVGILQKQIEQGAPADVFISAAAKQMQALQDGGLIINETRRDLLNNKIVLIVPANSTLSISNFIDLLSDDVSKIAIGDPAFTPVGTYGIQALDIYGISKQLNSKFILCSDVRQVLNYVERGDVEAGIVFITDALISTKVKVVASAPAEINAKIVYPVAVIKASKNVAVAKAYIAFLFSDEAKVIFEKYGFTMVTQ